VALAKIIVNLNERLENVEKTVQFLKEKKDETSISD
jgi:hypothetical protein